MKIRSLTGVEVERSVANQIFKSKFAKARSNVITLAKKGQASGTAPFVLVSEATLEGKNRATH